MLSSSLRSNRRGNNIVEFAILAPWYLFLSIGAFDLGIYNYSLIGVQNAARTVALYCSASSTTCPSSSNTPCLYALDQLRDLPNVGGSVTAPCTSPVTVSVSYVNGPDGNTSAQVTVTYATPNLIPLPGNLLPGQYTASRTVTMRTQS